MKANDESTVCYRVGHARLALTLINRLGPGAKSAAQTVRRATSSQEDTDLTH